MKVAFAFAILVSITAMLDARSIEGNNFVLLLGAVEQPLFSVILSSFIYLSMFVSRQIFAAANGCSCLAAR